MILLSGNVSAEGGGTEQKLVLDSLDRGPNSIGKLELEAFLS